MVNAYVHKRSGSAKLATEP